MTFGSWGSERSADSNGQRKAINTGAVETLETNKLKFKSEEGKRKHLKEYS